MRFKQKEPSAWNDDEDAKCQRRDVDDLARPRDVTLTATGWRWLCGISGLLDSDHDNDIGYGDGDEVKAYHETTDDDDDEVSLRAHFTVN